jgi:hypothetical protein
LPVTLFDTGYKPVINIALAGDDTG